ncbi:DUF2312 domain-containing protein [Roseibium polysiphoniae]|uniref:DUF2312 domain-containing protein n=1 Tax=Roseibium polysiphoniae TaxID=2571221 RepID=UPI0020B1925F|nr:DUF2312 domain-containing protein [Roseibium polysiphoniae]
MASETLKGFFSEIERLEEEKAQVSADITEIFKAAKGWGFDVDAMRDVLKRKKMSKEDLDAKEAQIDLYEGVLGLHGDKTEAEDMGIQAASEGQPLTGNPYTKKDPRHTKWANAWNMQTALMAATGDKASGKADAEADPDTKSGLKSEQAA